MKGKEFFKQLGEKVGLDADSISRISGNSALDTLEIPEDIASNFKTLEVFTEESAKANPRIRAAIKAEYGNGVEANLKSFLSKKEIDETELSDIFSGDKFSVKMEKAIERVAELERKKISTSGKEKNALEKEIEKLNKDILSTKESYEAKLSDIQKTRDNDLINYELKSLYNGFNYALPDEMPQDVKVQTARAVVESRLREKGVKFKMTETGLAPFTADDTPYFEDNKKISTADLLKKTLLENKVLKVNDGNNGGQQKHNFQQQQQGQERKPMKGMEKLNQAVQESLQRNGIGA